MLQIIGWLFVIWLIGSAIYSTYFHGGNYLLQRRRIQNGEDGEGYERAHEQFNWTFIIVMQIIKLSLACLIIYFFLMPSSEPSSKTAYWTEEIKRDITAGIKGNKPLPGFTEDQMTEYSNFILERIMQEYPDPEKMPDRLPDEFVLKVQREYFNKYRND